MEKRTKNPVLGCIGSSIIKTSRTLFKDYGNLDNEIKSIDELYETGKLSEDDKKTIDELKLEERKLRKKLEYAKNSIRKQIETGNRTHITRMQIIEKEKE